jgi:hypothetical protein
MDACLLRAVGGKLIVRLLTQTENPVTATRENNEDEELESNGV